jgi:hypothetical protein
VARRIAPAPRLLPSAPLAPPGREFFRLSEEWAWIAQTMDARLEELRTDLENTSHDERDTAAIRGRISEVRQMLALHEKAALATGAAPSPLHAAGAVLFDPDDMGSNDRG